MNTIKHLAISQILLNAGFMIMIWMIKNQDERINNLERVKLKTTQELIDETNKLIRTGKTH